MYMEGDAASLNKRWWGWIAAAAIAVSGVPAAQADAAAAGSAAQVRVADFPIAVNGQTIDNTKLDYPFLFYKDITYVPLTWDLTMELGLRTEWDAASGLKVYGGYVGFGESQGGWHKEPMRQTLTGSNPAGKSYTARVASYPIQLWGQQVDNEEETYPFLEFRDVTYMPLTWKFAHDVLHLDLRWSGREGLAVYGGQEKVFGYIAYDDEQALYIATALSKDRTYSMMKVSKSLQEAPVWLGPDETKVIRDNAEQALKAKGGKGKSVKIDQDGDQLSYKGIPLTTLLPQEKEKLYDYERTIEGTLYEIDDRRMIVGVRVYYPFPAMGPNPGRQVTVAITDGKPTVLTDFPYWPEAVLKDGDGNAWILRDRYMGRHQYIPGSGAAAVMDKDGQVRNANKEWNEKDVTPIGLTSPTYRAVGGGNHLVVALYGWTNEEEPKAKSADRLDWLQHLKWTPEGLYVTDASLQLRRLSDAPEGEMYIDREGDIYELGTNSNTIANWSKDLSGTWTDIELMSAGTK